MVYGTVFQDDLKDYGREKGYCPYFLARHAVIMMHFCWLQDIIVCCIQAASANHSVISNVLCKKPRMGAVFGL